MTIGVSKELTKVSVMEEVTEGVYVPPAADTDYIAPIEGGYSIAGSKETKERTILTAGFGKATPRVGQKSVEFQMNVEARGSGVEGEETDFAPLVKNMIGGSRNLAARLTSGAGHTTSVINMPDTTGLNVGDIICVLESGAHHISPITTVTANTSIELLVAMPSAPSDAVEISKHYTYFASNDQNDFKTLSVSMYHGDEIRETAVGARPTSMALSNFTTGELATFDFSGSGLDFDRVDGSAPHTPNYDDETPPLILGACIYVDGSQITANNFGFSIEHDNGFITSTCSESGKISSRKSGKRTITGSFNPYMDDTDVSLYDKFKNNTSFSVFAFAANPGAVDGEYDLGSIWGVYMPNCISTQDVAGDQEGIVTTEVAFSADAGVGGEETELYLSFI